MGEFTYRMMSANGQAVCGVMPTNTPEMQGVPPHWSVYIAVDDVDARLAKCQALGAKVVHGPMDVPSVGRMVLIQDPQGAHVWLFQSVPG
jgi:predicted enzyme related to lactoylglutathione lyase